MVDLGIDGPARFHYLPTTEDDRDAMLQTIGVGELDDLFADIPSEYRNPPLDLPGPLSELGVAPGDGGICGTQPACGGVCLLLGGWSVQSFHAQHCQGSHYQR